MAIIKETLENGLVRHYSDSDKMIKQVETGVLYSDAIDVEPCDYTYEETDVVIDDKVYSHYEVNDIAMPEDIPYENIEIEG